jgi:hypothetical protein
LTARTLLFLTPTVVLAACLGMVVLIVATKVPHSS